MSGSVSRSVSRQTNVLLLVAANVGALVAVVLTWPGSAAGQTQPGTTVKPLESRARGDYTMVSGRIGAGGNHVVYVVDSANQEVMALRWDNSKLVMVGIGYRSLASDGRGARGR